MRCKFAAKPGKIESSVDLPHQMIFGNRVAKMKLVEQLTLATLQTAHHGSTSPRFASTQRNHGSPHLSTDFCNKICQKPTQYEFSGVRSALWVVRKERRNDLRDLSGKLLIHRELARWNTDASHTVNRREAKPPRT